VKFASTDGKVLSYKTKLSNIVIKRKNWLCCWLFLMQTSQASLRWGFRRLSWRVTL